MGDLRTAVRESNDAEKKRTGQARMVDMTTPIAMISGVAAAPPMFFANTYRVGAVGSVPYQKKSVTQK